MKELFLRYEADQHHFKLISTGDWTLNSVRQIETELLEIPCDKKIVWDVSGVNDFDSAGVLLFIEYLEKFQKATQVEVVGYSANQKEMYTLLNKSFQETAVSEKKVYLENLGRKAFDAYKDLQSFTTFIGHLFYALFHTFFHPKDIRFKVTVYHFHQ